MEVAMKVPGSRSAVRSVLVALIAAIGIFAATNALAADQVAAEPPKQSGSYLIKFYKDVDEAAIKEVADYYGAKRVDPLSDSEVSDRKDPQLWRKLRFESVTDLKDIARRIVMDNRVDELE
jgi:hypothetical protein